MSAVLAGALAMAAVGLAAAGAGALRRQEARARLAGPHRGAPGPPPPAVFGRTLRALPRRRSDAPLLSLLDGLERSLRSGASLRQALAEAAVTDEHRALVDDVERRGVVPAFDRWAGTAPAGSADALAAAALSLAAATGAASARAVDGVAATVRLRLALHDELRALSAQARASAALISLAPVGFLALTSVIDPAVVAFFATPVGAVVLIAGLGLDAAGALWMARITRAATR